MNEILRIVREAETQKLCSRCLGRLFGKLGSNLDNPTRGKALRLLSHLENVLDSKTRLKENDHYASNDISNELEDIVQLLETFAFNEEHMGTICNVLGLPYNVHPKKYRNTELNKEQKISLEMKIESKNFKKLELLEEHIRSMVDATFVDWLTNDKNFPGHETPQPQQQQPQQQPRQQPQSQPPIHTRARTQDNDSCLLCKDMFDELPKFTELVCEAVKGYEFDDFLIGCKLDTELVSQEEELWSFLGAMHPEPMKSEFNRELGKLVGPRLGKNVNFETPEITILVDTRYDNIKLQIASLFVYGRYRKLVRDIPQTKWPCKRCWGKGCKKCNGTGKIYPTSVEELIAEKLMQVTKGKTHLFHGMGREDISVRMLGDGRPFILEVTEPVCRNIDLDILQREINEFAKDKVEVTNLKFSTHRDVRLLKAAKPSKTYKVKVNFNKEVNKGKLKNIVSTFSGRIIKQRTPIRVSHRRADLVRERKVLDMKLSAMIETGTAAELEITGESGLYIKELIIGDSERTEPSLAEELGIECSVLELDVLRINDD